jgi:hypothetical protein
MKEREGNNTKLDKKGEPMNIAGQVKSTAQG